MKTADYLRRQAAELRARARDTADTDLVRQLEELARACEKLAAEMANGHDRPKPGP